jgi:transposase
VAEACCSQCSTLLVTLLENCPPPVTENSPDASRLDLWLDFASGSPFACPKCATAGKPVHDTTEKEWRHMDFFHHMCYLHARVPLVRCEDCGVLQVSVP